MYSLRLVKPTEYKNCQEINDLLNDLPTKPYCTNIKGYCHPRTKKTAIKHAYIQPNHPAVAQWLVFDIDDKNALFAYYDNDTPPPQLIIKNPVNGHAHYCYKLSEKMGLWGKSSQKAIEYLKAVYRALRSKLGADTAYSGNLIKNPIHSDWQTYTTGAEKSYTLDQLAVHLDLNEPPPKAVEVETDEWYFGRNHEIFERTRHQAYRIADKYGYDELYREVLAITKHENERFRYPLDPKELHHIAKSITSFCKSPRFGVYSVAFITKKRRQGRNGGLKSDSSKGGLARSANFDDKREQAIELWRQGKTVTQIAKELDCHRNSVKNWLINL